MTFQTCSLSLWTGLICCLWGLSATAWPAAYTLNDQQVEIKIDANGNLASLRNLQTGLEYAGGKPLWRLYFDRKNGEQEIEVRGAENTPKIRRDANRIVLQY
ncbi:MAG: hypothetical protein FJ088_11160, partial [Deltaproteobacteria bacterium]|nr:hypothetical protein [Deltaproteobacteria bacterium]